MARMPLVLRIARVNLDDPSADIPGFGIPANVIADFEHLAHTSHLDRCDESIVILVGCAFARRGARVLRLSLRRHVGWFPGQAQAVQNPPSPSNTDRRK